MNDTGDLSSISVSIDVTAIPMQPGGVGRYVFGLLGALEKVPGASVTLISRSGDFERWNAIAPRACVRDIAPGARPVRIAWEQARLPGIIEKLGVSVHHGPHYTMPESAEVPKVVTIHDVTFFGHPEWHQRAKVPFFRRAIKVACKSANVLVCVSESTAEGLRSKLVPKGRVLVVPHGVDHIRFSPEEPEENPDDQVLKRIGVSGPYVAFVGTVEPRKDVPTLIKAFDKMCTSHPSLTLVIAGSPGWGEAQAASAISDARNSDRIIRLGYIEDAAVPALLRRASAVAYPSLEEGFGLPVLEALACAGPVVTTTGSAMEEVASGAALLVPPGDVDALAGNLDMLVRGDASLDQRRRKGLEIAASHTWEASAMGHLNAYRMACEEPSALDLGERESLP